MKAKVWRLFHKGQPVDRSLLRASRPAEGELGLRLRVGGRDERQDVHLAYLTAPDDSYLVPVLDHARVIEVRGAWLRLVGVEVIPEGRSIKRLRADRYKQEWWCRLESTPAGPRGDR